MNLLIFISLFCLTFSSTLVRVICFKGASVDGSTMITYIGDSHIRYGNLYFKPRGVVRWNNDNHMRPQFKQTFRSDSASKETYQVIGFMNEYQVSIGETTFGGRSS